MQDLNKLALPDLFPELVSGAELDQFVERVRVEDLSDIGDVTTMSIVTDACETEAKVVAREAGMVAGMIVAQRFVDGADGVTMSIQRGDGVECAPGDVIATLRGSLAAILTVERPLLNVVGWLSGIASLTCAFVKETGDNIAEICCTRKTTPGCRGFEKYAVRCGGGTMHRLGLYDALLYKDNHLAHVAIEAWTETLQAAIIKARDAHELRFVEIECDTLEQYDTVLAIDEGLVDLVLLDNMPNDLLATAVAERDVRRPDIRLEASGGVNIDTVRGIAETGVDRISVGALTHSARCLDIGLDIDPS